MTLDSYEYRTTIGLFATGVAVISVGAGDHIHGMTANAITSVSLEPLLLLVCIDRRARMGPALLEAGRFAVNILGAGQQPLSRHFAGHPDPQVRPRFEELAGAPALAESLASLTCSIDRVLDGGDHLIVIGRVEALRRMEEPDAPLLYFGGTYRELAA